MGLADFERSTNSPGHSSFHLERMNLLLERLGNPHLGAPTVHVAGTKGKGSTVAMVTSILGAAGSRVGLYTSPHLHSVVERIRIGMTPIARGDFATLVDSLWPAVEWTGRHGEFGDPSTFDLLTAMAFCWFSRQEVDYQVLEVGLGGRLDATNVVAPEVCAITRISLDHVATLGSTLTEIAFEKAGIMKTGVPTVLAPQPAEALAEFRRIAAERAVPLQEVGDRFRWSRRSAGPAGQEITIAGRQGTYDARLPLAGDHQIDNAATAVGVVEALRDGGRDISDEAVVKGLESVSWPGRLQSFTYESQQVVVDGAHNPDSMGRLVRTLREQFAFGEVVVVFGGLSGHNSLGMLEELAVLGPQIVAVRSRHPRSAPSADVAALSKELGMPVPFQTDDVGEGVRAAVALAGREDLVLGTGSLSVVAEVIEEVEGLEAELYPIISPPAGQSV